MSHRPNPPRLAPTLLLLAAVLAPLLAPAASTDAQTAQLGPQELMASVSKRMFESLDANRAAIREDPEKAYMLVDTILLPYFDTEYAAQRVLAQNWRTATPEQQKRFIDALYRALRRTYGGAIADFTADRLKLLPFRGDPAATPATVRTRVTRSSGAVVDVNYRLRKTAGGWKVFDVVIEGLSYLENCRTDLGAEASQKGLEEVITRLEHHGLDLRIASDNSARGAKH